MTAGSLQEKAGKLYAVLHLGNGKYKWKCTGLTIKGNKKKAQIFLDELIAEYDSKKVINVKKILFSVYIKNWLNDIKSSVELSTWNGYEYIINKHVVPYFNDLNVSVQDLEPFQIQKYYNLKLEEGLSPNTVKHHHANIRKALQDALMQNIIPYNVADRVKVPKCNTYQAKFYDVNQISQLLDLVKDTQIETVILLTSFYGLRRSEVLGLKWSAINFSNNTLVINNTITNLGGIIEKERTKNKASHRTMPLAANIKKHLQLLNIKQKENRLLFGNEYIENDYICTWENGKIFSPDYVSHKFKEIIVSNNMPVIRFHDLRHSCASVLLAHNFDIKKIQAWLGHSSIATTGNIYAHIQHSSKVEIGNVLEKSLENIRKY